MHFPGSFLCSSALTLCLTISAAAQVTQPAPVSSVAPPDAAATGIPAAIPDPDAQGGLIRLDVHVTDKKGHAVLGLGPGNFTILDNGQPRKLLSFSSFEGHATAYLPGPEVLLLLDAANLSPVLAMHVKDEMQKFLLRNNGHLEAPVSIFVTDPGEVRLLAGPSTDGRALAAALKQPERGGLRIGPTQWASPVFDDLVQPGGSTGPFDLKTLAALAAMERQRPAKKVLIWIGPGSGAGSGTYDDSMHDQQQRFDLVVYFSTLLREARITLFNVSVGAIVNQQTTYRDPLQGAESPQHTQLASLSRNVLAVQSGGGVPPPSDDIAGIIANCATTAHEFYTLSFDPVPTTQTDEYHALTVQLDDPTLHAQTNTGYYDQSFYHVQSNPSAKRVTMAELEMILRQLVRKRDGEAAHELSRLQLTERFTSARLGLWHTRIHGKNTQRALNLLADRSAFLPLPPSDVAQDAPPSLAQQRHIIAQAETYVAHALPRLPNFYANRTATRYVETASFDESNERVRLHPLHHLDTFRASVLYRDGKEILKTHGKNAGTRNSDTPDFTTYGTFGPSLGMLGDVLVDTSAFTWSRWEEAPQGRRAIFHVAIPQDQSRYLVGGCCLPEGDGKRMFRKYAAYDGEIAIDPNSGAILRLQIQADLRDYIPFARSEVIISYAPVEIGGQTYICPIRSVSIWRARSIRAVQVWNSLFLTYGPYWTMVSEYDFDQFHVFRSTARILPDYTP